MTAGASFRGIGVLVGLELGAAVAAAGSTSQDIERAKQAARENRLLPEHEAFYRKAARETHELIEPLLEPCALQDCLGAGASNTYVVRVQSDGTFGEVFIEPSNRFTSCLASGLKAHGRLQTPPPGDNYWVQWAVSGSMRMPEGCREELTPPTWDRLKWWLFLADMVLPRSASRVRAILFVLSLAPFVLAIVGWKLLRPDDGGRGLLLGMLLGAGLVLLAAVVAYVIGSVASQMPDDKWQDGLVTVLFAFPLLSASPFALRGLRRPSVPRGSRHRVPTAGRARRALGLALLLAALVPAAGMAWFAAHENAHRLCATCVQPYKLRWVPF